MDNVATTGRSMFKPSSALDVDQERTLEYLERATPVRLIGTFDCLITVYEDESCAEAVAKAHPEGFDYLPVRDRTSDVIVGILPIALARTNLELLVRDSYERLHASRLIAGEAPLLHFIYSADTSPCRLILEGAEITGLVTLSDIQKLPVRIALFSLFIHLEMLLTEHLRRLVDDPTNPFHMLPEGRRHDAIKRWKSYDQDNKAQDALSALLFCDKKAIAMKLRVFDMTGTRIKKELEQIEVDLRNPIAHGSEYAMSESSARNTVHAARLVKTWIGMLRAQ